MKHIPLIILPAAIIMLSSSRRTEGGELNRRTTTVCSTAKGNGSHANCVVPYNDTELVLSCRTEWANLTEGFVPPGPLWRKDDCISGQILSQGHNYTMNDLGRRLTNDDSATYCCIDSVPSRTEYHYVHVNVHAPPSLLNGVYICKGLDSSSCYTKMKMLSVEAPSIEVTVNFTGNGPFSVQWYHNNTKYSCPERVCSMSDLTNNTQTLYFRKNSIEDGLMINGNYTAVVSNPFGSNRSTTLIRYDCVLHDTEHQMMQDKELDLLEGSDLNSSCELMGLTIDFDVVACLTRNKSDKIERILNNTLGNCVQFSNNVCTQHFNNSLAKIQVSMFEDKNGYCSPLQVTNFIKKSITLHDNGLVILCGFHGLNNNIKRYASLRLRVHSHERPNYYFVLYALITGLVTSVVLFVTIIIIVIIYKRGHSKSTVFTGDRHRALVRESDYEGEQTHYDEREPLLNSSIEQVEQPFTQLLCGSLSQSLQGTIAPVEYLASLEGPETNVFI